MEMDEQIKQAWKVRQTGTQVNLVGNQSEAKLIEVTFSKRKRDDQDDSSAKRVLTEISGPNLSRPRPPAKPSSSSPHALLANLLLPLPGALLASFFLPFPHALLANLLLPLPHALLASFFLPLPENQRLLSAGLSECLASTLLPASGKMTLRSLPSRATYLHLKTIPLTWPARRSLRFQSGIKAKIALSTTSTCIKCSLRCKDTLQRKTSRSRKATLFLILPCGRVSCWAVPFQSN
ncbi:hypothetical protein BDZ88DRAFT_286730 [Geranomyces variabilis]|nr:hypothetical protein BDZ88DRAFT_286730 [Geranomyces variabilis]